jgi:hypothetical protein
MRIRKVFAKLAPGNSIHSANNQNYSSYYVVVIHLKKMLKFLIHNSKGRPIKSWLNKVWTLIDKNEELKARINESGILDGPEIVSDYLKNNEFGLAYEHLIYMIQDSGIYLTDDDYNEIAEFSLKLGLEKPELTSPTSIEVEEFYRILELFNLTQKKAVNKLTGIWGMEFPINCDEWIEWSQNQYDKNGFQNNEGVKIFPHGFGLSYQDSEIYIDFDFGEHGETSGFDVNRLWFFIKTNEIKTLFKDEKQIKKVVDNQTAEGKLEFSGYINYYRKTEL